MCQNYSIKNIQRRYLYVYKRGMNMDVFSNIVAQPQVKTVTNTAVQEKKEEPVAAQTVTQTVQQSQETGSKDKIVNGIKTAYNLFLYSLI